MIKSRQRELRSLEISATMQRLYCRQKCKQVLVFIKVWLDKLRSLFIEMIGRTGYVRTEYNALY